MYSKRNFDIRVASLDTIQRIEMGGEGDEGGYEGVG